MCLSISVTSASTFASASARAALRPPKPAPTTTTCVRLTEHIVATLSRRAAVCHQSGRTDGVGLQGFRSDLARADAPELLEVEDPVLPVADAACPRRGTDRFDDVVGIAVVDD